MLSSIAPTRRYPIPTPKRGVKLDYKGGTEHTSIVNDDVHTPMDRHSLLSDLMESIQRRCDIQFENIGA